jgi:hypothetical protein
VLADVISAEQGSNIGSFDLLNDRQSSLQETSMEPDFTSFLRGSCKLDSLKVNKSKQCKLHDSEAISFGRAFREESMRNRLNLFVAISVLIALALVGISARAWFDNPDNSKKDMPQPPSACCSGQAQATGTPVPIAVTTFIAPGLGVALESVSANRDRGRQVITCTVVNRGQEKIEALEVMLMAFTSKGMLSRVEGRLLRLATTPGAKRSASFSTDLSHESPQTQTLAVKGMIGETNRQEVEARELIEELAKNKATGANPRVNVKEKSNNQVAFTPNICYESFRLAHTLAQNSSGNFGVTGSFCDQHRRAFSISFAPVMRK